MFFDFQLGIYGISRFDIIKYQSNEFVRNGYEERLMDICKLFHMCVMCVHALCGV